MKNKLCVSFLLILINLFANNASANEFILNDFITLQKENSNIFPKETGIIYKEAETYFTAINPQKEDSKKSYYPGFRGPNELIVYTPIYGERTGTNEFGTEAIIENNTVTQLNGSDSIIPYNGFVISGHGTAKKWITENIQLGSKVYIDPHRKIIKTFLTPQSLIFAAKERIKEVKDLIEYYNQIDILYNDKRAQDYLEKAKEDMRKAEKNTEKAQSYIMDSMKSLNLATQNAIPYIKNELKGVWIRPTEKTPHEIEKAIEKLNNAGITDIFLETYFHGKTIYPSNFLRKEGVTSQRQEFVGFDPLNVWIEEAHKKGIKIHVWFETFYVGNENPQLTKNHVLNIHPNWSNKRLMNYDSQEPVASLSEHNGYFLDPANQEVRDYLQNILKEIIDNYNIDGINLDYIRYPQTVDSSFSNYATMNWGYTEYARNEFKNIYRVDPIDIQYKTAEWELWDLYRQDKISSFVKDVRTLTKDKPIMITAVIFPDIKKCLEGKMQNWRKWSFYGYVDGLTPLILTGDKNTAKMLINDVMQNTSPITNIYTGLFVTFMGGSPEDLLMQLQKAREYKAKGSIIFDYAHFEDSYIDALKVRVYNEQYDDRNYKIGKEAKQNIEEKPELKVKLNKRKKKRK